MTWSPVYCCSSLGHFWSVLNIADQESPTGSAFLEMLWLIHLAITIWFLVKDTQILMHAQFVCFKHVNFKYKIFTCCLLYPTYWHTGGVYKGVYKFYLLHQSVADRCRIYIQDSMGIIYGRDGGDISPPFLWLPKVLPKIPHQNLQIVVFPLVN